MDIFAHGLWTNIMYQTIPTTRSNKRVVSWGVLFGILPDLVSFTPVFVIYVFGLIMGRQAFHFGPPQAGSAAFAYAVSSYNFTHSLVVWIVGFSLIWVVSRKFPWFALGWALHIIIDLFTHPDFFRTPVLFPVSGFHNPYAISWAHPVFMVVNYSLLFVFYFFLLPFFKRKRLP